MDESELWRSKVHTRWQGPTPMTTSRQRELIEEYVAELPALPRGCPRRTQPEAMGPRVSLQRDQRVRLAPSALLPALTAVYIDRSHAVAGKRFVKYNPRDRLLDYKGWILTEAEYDRFGYAVHTAVSLECLFDDSPTTYVLLGDPTTPAAQVNCVRGSGKSHPNARLILNPSQFKKRAAGPTRATDSLVTVRATKILKAGQEVWIDYGQEYWDLMSLYCPLCLEYEATADDQMLICEAPGCKRAWHQLCLQPCLIEVPDGPFLCDLHTR